MNEAFSGTGVALVTPFLHNEVDYPALERVLHHTIEGGVDYVVALGTTAETPTLDPQERMAILDFIVAKTAGRVPVVAGFGGNDTRYLVKAIKNYHFDGVAAILSASPSYNKPTQEGLYQHFMAIAEACPRPILLYNVPARTSRNITAETTLRLAYTTDKFIGIKEASGDFAQCMTIARDKPRDFLLLSGDDLLALPMMAFGAKGVISVIANAYPRAFTRLVQYALHNNYAAAAQAHAALLDLMQLIFIDGNPAGVKGALALQGLCSTEVRLPLVPLTHDTFDRIRAAAQKLINYPIFA